MVEQIESFEAILATTMSWGGEKPRRIKEKPGILSLGA